MKIIIVGDMHMEAPRLTFMSEDATTSTAQLVQIVETAEDAISVVQLAEYQQEQLIDLAGMLLNTLLAQQVERLNGVTLTHDNLHKLSTTILKTIVERAGELLRSGALVRGE